MQICIFDVTDFANPALMYKQIIGGRGTDSEANSNPKAFNYYPAQNALAFPLDVYTVNGQRNSTYGPHEFTGLYVYRVTVENGFEYLGRIAADGASQYGYVQLNRGVFIGDTVYGVSSGAVKAASLDDVATLDGQITLTTP